MAGNGIPPQFNQYQWQQPQPLQPTPPPSTNSPSEEVRTIFIAGLPADVKERELHNLLRWFPGFESSQLNNKTEPPVGFGLFTTPQFAITAKDSLQDMVFDSENKSVLHIEMAKKNLFAKRGGVADVNIDQSKRMRTGGDYTHAAYPAPAPAPAPIHFHPPPQPVWGHQGYMPPPPPPQPQYDPYAVYPVPQVQMPPPGPLPVYNGYAPVQNNKDNPPCNTLFIGNLGENVIEEEVRNIFSVQPGFKQMKILRQERNTVCFIEFNDVASATNVHTNLQGAVVPSSVRGGMRIQYSKNPFGRRRDGFNSAGMPEGNGAPPQLTY